jgi:polygalacturonase
VCSGIIIANANNSRREFLRMLTYSIGAAAAPIARPASGRTRLDVRTFGAVADGSVIDTPAINRAIQAASANCGGEVYFPPGHYLCFSIRLRSDVTIVIAPGAVLIAASPGSAGSYDDVHAEPPGVYQDYGRGEP